MKPLMLIEKEMIRKSFFLGGMSVIMPVLIIEPSGLITQFNGSYTFATGRPYYNINYDYNGNAFKIYDAGRTKDYSDLSLSVNYLPSIGKANAKSFTVVVLSVSNVLGVNKVYTYNFSANGQNKVAVTPPSKRFLYLGCFISLGIDRTQDEINNHL